MLIKVIPTLLNYLLRVNKVFFICSILLSVSLFTACSQKQVPYQASILVFGTTVNITVYDNSPDRAEKAVYLVEQKFHEFHRQWHAWEQGGIVSKINHAIAVNKAIEVAPSVKAFILKSQKLTRESLGLFDPGIGQLIALWGFHSENWQGPPPAKALITDWLSKQPSLLDIYFKDLTLYSHNPHVQLDFGGNAKGLAIDIALQQLLEAGIKNALVSIGGDMKGIGSKNGQPWLVGIQDPHKTEQALASIQLKSGESIVTSGTYQRYFEWKGQHYSHIINPKTGYPADSFASVTVLHPNATTADAAATALLVAGPKEWKKVIQSMQIELAFLIDKNGQFFQTDAMANRIKLLDNTP